MKEPIILSRGVDTLKINVKLNERIQELPVDLEARFASWQEQAREQVKPVATTLTFHEARMTMLPNGAPAWKYLIKNDCLQLQVGPRLHLPMVCKVTFSSAYLWAVGSALDAMEEAHGFLVDLFGTKISLQAAQLDLCVDLIGLTLPTEWQQVFISHAIGKSSIGESQKDREYYHGRSLQTITLSGHGRPFSCKIYDKTAEIRQRSRKKVWFFDLWRQVTQPDGTSVWNEQIDTPPKQRVPVHRVEFSIERSGLHEVNLEDAYEAIDNIKRLWAYCTQDWLRMVIPGRSRNRHRWVTHPTWTLIQHAFHDYDLTSIEGLGPLVRKRQLAADIEQGVAQVAGQATTLAAWMHELGQDLDALDVFHAVYTKVVERWATRRVDISATVQEKRVRYHQVS